MIFVFVRQRRIHALGRAALDISDNNNVIANTQLGTTLTNSTG
jgi:hypothetical protein